MNEHVNTLITELQNATFKLDAILDVYQENLDYFNEVDRRKITDFKVIFERKREAIDASINSFVRFIKKSFAPSQKDILKEKALQKLHNDFPDFDSWDENVKHALLDRELKTLFSRQSVNASSKRPTTGESVYLDNPNTDQPHSINENFVFSKPYKIEFLSKEYAVKNWRDVLCVIANSLYTDNPAPLNSYIVNDDSKKPKFAESILPNYRRPIEIAKGIYTDANRNATDMLNLCRLLLQIYSIDEDEITIYLSKIAKNE
ncbi:MAG TPA: hypothetical protein DEO38_04665 [Bacteroidales bacterium]|nr:hypothetical protein [Bacteroidales bacterium]